MGAAASISGEGPFSEEDVKTLAGDAWDAAKWESAEKTEDGKVTKEALIAAFGGSSEAAPAAEEAKEAEAKTEDEWWLTAGTVDEENPRNTEDFKYRTYSERPPMVHTSEGGKHKSLMCKNLTTELFEELKDVKTGKGYTLSNAIQTGVMTPHLGVGITAGDEECWTAFAKILNPVIKGWHGFDPETDKHVSDLDPEHVEMSAETLERFNKYVASTRIRAARNVSGFSLPAGATVEDRHGVAEVLQKAFSKFEGDLKGTYYDLGSLTDEQTEDLRSNGFLFQKPKPTNLLTYCGAARSWPDDRGIFHNDERTALCWCNEEDHCRIISMSKDGDVKGVFKRFCELSHAIKASVESDGGKFMFSETLGFLGTCASNLGTGLRASVMVKLEKLNENVELLEEICASLDLQPRGSAGEHSAAVGAKWDISNKQRIGFSEVQLVQKMINGVNKLLDIEEKLASGAEVVKGVDWGVAAAEAAAPAPAEGGEAADAAAPAEGGEAAADAAPAEGGEATEAPAAE